MLQINLLPVREARLKEERHQLLMQAGLVALLLAAAIGFTHSKIVEDIELSQARKQQMQRDIDQYEPQLKQVAAFRNKKKELETKIGVIDELDRARSGPVRVLAELASRTPDRLWLTSLATEGQSIVMAGKSLDNELVALFLRHLGESEYFDKVDLDKTQLGAETGGLRLMSFTIRAVLVNPGAPKPAADAKPAPAAKAAAKTDAT